MSLSKFQWILENINESPIMAALLGCGSFFFVFGVVLNIATPVPIDDQRKLLSLDVSGEGWPMILAGVLGWMTALAAYHAWSQRYLLVAICALAQGYLMQDVGRLSGLAVLAGILAVAVDYVQSD